MHRHPTFFLGLALLLHPALAGAGAQTPAEPSAQTAFDPATLPPIVATVDGVSIGREWLQDEATAAHEELKASGEDRVVDEAFYREALDQIIAGLLLEKEAARHDLAATPEEVEARMTEARRPFPDEAAFLAALERSGTTLEGLRRDLRQQISIAKLVTLRIRPAIRVSEERITALYEENREQLRVPERVRVRHIFLPIAADATPEARAEAQAHASALLERLRAGADFAEVARAESRDPSAATGGALPWLVRGQTLPEFEAAAFALEPGTISGVVTSTAGLHILQVLEHRPEGIAGLDEARPGLTESFRDAALEPILRRRVAELELAADVERFALGPPPSP